jgi:glycosyltransferase involved in cell wall biosynthesis
MSKPLVSIVTPSYNQVDFLEHTMRSVLSQDYPQVEYLVADGGSTDGSVELIQRYAHQLEWWVSEPDRGQAEAINKGLRRAQGEIVAWLNSDDLYWPGAVSEAVAALETHPEAGFVYANATSIDGSGRPFNDMIFKPYDLDDLLCFNIICQPAVFMRHDVLQTAGYLQSEFHYLLDHSLWVRMARLAPMTHIPSFWAFARYHPAAKNIALAAEFGDEAFRILNWARDAPDLAARIERQEGRVLAGANRYRARYLLDAGKGRQALQDYLRSLRLHPRTALQEWHRIIFAGLSALGLGFLGGWYRSWARRTLPPSVRGRGWENVHKVYGGEQLSPRRDI